MFEQKKTNRAILIREVEEALEKAKIIGEAMRESIEQEAYMQVLSGLISLQFVTFKSQ